MNFNKDTKVKDILHTYPWLKDELIKMDDRFKIINSPIGKMMLKKATLEDVSKKVNIDINTIIQELTKFIKEHQ